MSFLIIILINSLIKKIICIGTILSRNIFVWNKLHSTQNFGKAAKRILFDVPDKQPKLPPGDGPLGSPEARLSQMRRCVRALIQHERIELPWPVATEARLYTERLIQETIIAEDRAGGPNSLLPHITTQVITPTIHTSDTEILELIKFWLGDTKLIEKLLKVIVPRYRMSDYAYTSLHKLRTPSLPQEDFRANKQSVFGVLELNDNPWPPIGCPGLPTRVELLKLGKVRDDLFKRRFSQIAKIFDQNKVYNSKVIEDPQFCNELWKSLDVSKPAYSSNKPSVSFLLPPPNVTGVLHLGHALTCSIQDTLARYYRMSGHPVLWIPGLDHAGIATQAVVERSLPKGVTKHQLGRSEFEKLVWNWKLSKESLIKTQLKQLGLTIDWSKEYFTLNQDLSLAVTEAFQKLWMQGLIYRDQAIVSWCTALQSAISDIEVDTLSIEKPTKLDIPGYSRKIEFGYIDKFAYRLKNSDQEIVVATTRLETMLGDTAICVHPEDKRYSPLIGQLVEHPFYSTRNIPIIADSELASIDKGTGAVKVSPAHSLADFQLSKRKNIPILNILNKEGKISLDGPFKNLSRFDARESIRENLIKINLFRGREPYPLQLPVCSRTGDVIEPLLLNQWFLRTKELAKKALDAVNDNKLTLVPNYHVSKWKEWLSPNSQRDWCISRQLWWGHRIPAFKLKSANQNEDWIVSGSIQNALKTLQAKNPDIKILESDIIQDEDVLDTWFSSALLPLSSLGWPKLDSDENRHIWNQHFPMTFVETGSDILFFWVARMVMLSLALTEKLPFNKVFLHGMIRDKDGKKMSKSSGNVIDPISIISGDSGFGVDILRFSLLSKPIDQVTVPYSQDSLLDGKKFCNKIWQTIKFLKLRLTIKSANEMFNYSDLIKDFKNLKTIDKWILHQLCDTLELQHNVLNSFIDKNESFILHLALIRVKKFWIEELCSIYLEIVKYRSINDNSGSSILKFIILTGLHMLHPFMPHVTEIIWKNLTQSNSSLSLQRYPLIDKLVSFKLNDKELSQIHSYLSLANSVNHWRYLLNIKKSDSRFPIILKVSENQVSDLSEIIYALTSIQKVQTSQIEEHSNLLSFQLPHSDNVTFAFPKEVKLITAFNILNRRTDF